jgi:hypothetical protein
VARLSAAMRRLSAATALDHPSILAGEVDTFFGSPWEPALRREAIQNAATQLTDTGVIRARPWTDVRVGGQFVIDAIVAVIDQCALAAFDVTDLNGNVWFELGYAIGRNKRIWLLRDDTSRDSAGDWQRLKLLTTIGYTPFVNSQHIVAGFYKDRPDLVERTVFDTAIAQALGDEPKPTLLYLPSLHETEAGRAITRRLSQERKRGLMVIADDPNEAAVRPLSWYAQTISSSLATVVHFTSPSRTDARIHNARCALVSGLAHGLGRPLLMLAEADFYAPIDYRDLLRVYRSANTAAQAVDQWIGEQLSLQTLPEVRARSVDQRRREATLKSIHLGDFVAENEATELSEYFVETTAYKDVLTRNLVLFVGRKGSGKTANLIIAARDLASDRRNLVVVVKPNAYEFEGLVALIKRYRVDGDQGFLVEAIWKFLLLTSIAKALAEELRVRPGVAADTREGQFLQFIDAHPELFELEFASRLELAVQSLNESPIADDGVTQRRARISEALHQGTMQRIEQLTAPLLREKRRVAVLVDNLDKGWTRDADIDELSRFILGLLASIGRVFTGLGRPHGDGDPRITAAIFLRSDIFQQVMRSAREPDKIPVVRVDWPDEALLLRIVQDRYSNSLGLDDGDSMWQDYFCSTVHGVDTKRYLLDRVLPKPRDFIYVCTTALSLASNRGSDRVQVDDLQAAEKIYSQNAVEALLVENGLTVKETEGVLIELLGGRAEMTVRELRQKMVAAGIEEDRHSAVIHHFFELSLIGVAVAPGNYRFSYDFTVPPFVSTLLTQDGRELAIHPAFRPFLEMTPSAASAEGAPQSAEVSLTGGRQPVESDR